MKQKMLQLLMFFLLTSLFVSSKQNSMDCGKIQCAVKSLPVTEWASQSDEKTEVKVAAYPFALAPGSYLFRY